MNAFSRTFVDSDAVRSKVPLLIGIMGCSGSGKTFSALRLASGIQQVSGGDIFFIDTEARRALHYSDQFKFRHIDFKAPFGSLDYLAALQHCVAKGAGVIVIDSMSHEHTGPGGYLLTQDAEVDRMAGGDTAKRERVKMAGWIKPSGLRQQMINGILQLNCNFIFCFRAKEKTKPQPGKQPIELGFMPIAGEEMLFEQTVNCLLLPKSNGVPTWRSDQVGERMMMKLPRQFEHIFPDGKALDEDTGRAMAEWAKGDATSAPVKDHFEDARIIATRGTDAFRAHWKGITRDVRAALTPRIKELQGIAESADHGVVDDDPFTNSGPEPDHPRAAASPLATNAVKDAAAKSPPRIAVASDDFPGDRPDAEAVTLLDQARAHAMNGFDAFSTWLTPLSPAEKKSLSAHMPQLLDAAAVADGEGEMA